MRKAALILLVALAGCNSAKQPDAAPTPGATAAAAVALKPYAATDWSQADISQYGNPKEYAASRALCASLISAEPPAADFPTATEQASLKGCDSEKLYFGIGMPADPVKARQCAMIERTTKPDSPYGFFRGDAMLAMIYANGRGVSRNLDVAIHMACRMDDAPVAIDGRVKRLGEYRRTGWQGSDFDTCDDNTSGTGGGVCADHGAQLESQSRDQRIAKLKQGWTPAQQAAFDRVYTSLAAYAETAHDMDCHGGTAAAECTITGREADIERFLTRIEALAAGKPLPKDKPSEGPHPAISGKDYTDSFEYADEDERQWLTANREQAIADRQIFERDLLAFFALTLPRFNAHQVRAMFANI